MTNNRPSIPRKPPVTVTTPARPRLSYGQPGGVASRSQVDAHQASPGAVRMPDNSSPPADQPIASSGRGEYDFLLDTLIDADTLKMADAVAWHWGVKLHEALITLGWISPRDYTVALAQAMGLAAIVRQVRIIPFADRATDTPFSGVVHAQSPNWPYGQIDNTQPICNDNGPCQHATFFALNAAAYSPDEIRAILAQTGLGHRQVALLDPNILRRALETQTAPSMLHHAVNNLRQNRPDLSTGTPVWLWQVLAITCLVGLSIGGMLGAPLSTTIAITGVMTLPFLCVVILRFSALIESMANRDQDDLPHQRVNDTQLPVYSILVPVFRELEVLPDLIRSLRALDYPAAKLDIMLILEAIDQEMLHAVADLNLPPQFRVVVVPDAQPRTKPKALNYALQLARGEYVVVYDAEDLPEPDQLRKALAQFARAFANHDTTNIGCVQARLNIYNPDDGWLSRQFTIEYSALFDALLPAFERWRIPIPLGGTSNHFPRKVLAQLGDWDPFNVTEDADLGIRLLRAGFHVEMLRSTTWEEAPTTLSVWMKQRTRWLKGWMQTYLVHTRRPLVLLRELGAWRWLGLHILMGGILFSALVHPLFYLMVASGLFFEWFWTMPDSSLGAALMWMAGINLVVGYVSSIALGALAVARRQRRALALHALAMPVYWLFVSFAAYRAIWQLLRNPFEWEKTNHRARRQRELEPYNQLNG